MAALINPVVCSLFRFKTSWPKPTAENTLCDTETPDNQQNQETPVETGLTGFSTLLKPLPTWRRSVFRWLVGPVFAASSAADADQGVEGAPKEPAPDVADRTCWFDKGLSWICSLFARISTPSPGKVTKRIGYLQWEEYFMGIAFLSAKRSKDPDKQVGACIVNKEKKIVGIGYNGMPIGCSDDILSWNKGLRSELDNKHLFVCHAEMNAIVNKNEADVRDCTIYVSMFPCNECAKLIVQSGIKKVVYYSDEKAKTDEVKASKRIFELSDVNHRPYLSDGRRTVLVDFNDPTKDA